MARGPEGKDHPSRACVGEDFVRYGTKRCTRESFLVAPLYAR